MNIIKTTAEKLLNERPTSWDNLPDIDLYMDQVISYMQRQHIGFSEGESLTSSMINNYVKAEIMPRVKGKRYSKEHIAYLTVISLLKQIVPVSDISTIIGDDLNAEDSKRQYETFSLLLQEEFSKVGEHMSGGLNRVLESSNSNFDSFQEESSAVSHIDGVSPLLEENVSPKEKKKNTSFRNKKIQNNISDEEKSILIEKALTFAIISYANKLACQSILKELQR